MPNRCLALRSVCRNAVACLLAAAFGASWLVPVEAEDTTPNANGWISLFNGKDLAGWTPKIKGYELGDNFGNTFRVEDGVMKVSYDQYNRFDRKYGHIFYKDKFSHYRIRIEYRFVGEQCSGGEGWATRNSGVMLHCQPPETMAKDQDFPVSIEVQFLGGLGKGQRTTANLCTPGTHIVMNGKLIKQHCTNSKSKTYDGDQWVTVEAEVHGDKLIKHFVNGEEVLSYEQPQYDDSDATARPLIKNGQMLIQEGYISLQSESHPIEFRKVELLPLAPGS
jgi:3-keto-disaccharide hydrolase